MIKTGNEKLKRHRDRKNMNAADFFRKRRKEHNTLRPKQVWVGGESVVLGGHWERKAA